MKKILITGGMGFVGKYLTESLKENEVHITRLENESDYTNSHVLDICSADEVNKLIDEIKPDIIYHLAGQSSVAVSWKNPQLTVDVNIKGAVNLLEAVRNYSPDSKVILIGSSEEYGVMNCESVSENCTSSPNNIYAVTKYSQEMFGQIYFKAYGLKTIMTRSFNHMGAGQSDIFVISDFCHQAVKIEKGIQSPVIKTGDISVMRDFTDVKDIVKAYIKLAEYGKFGEVYNVGSGKATKISDILDIIIKTVGINITIEKDVERFRPSDVPKIQADISKIQADTGWRPEISLENTIKDIIDYWRNYEGNL